MMDSKELDNIINSIKETLGDDNSAMISDNLGMLITKNNDTIKELSRLNNEVDGLTKKNDNLVNANSRLLQQIPMEEDYKKQEPKKEESKKSFTLNDLFDEHGNFKKKL